MRIDGSASAAPAGSRREYRSAVREAQARQTRARIRTQASLLFLERGYAATTVADVASAAEVSAQTVYNAFGTKAALLKSVYDVTLVGDDEPVPLAGRPEMVAVLGAADGYQMLTGYAGVATMLLQRLAGVVGMVEQGAAAGEPDLIVLAETTAAERREGTGMCVERAVALSGLREGVSLKQAKDVVWALSDVRLWQLLVGRSGWSPQAFSSYLGRALTDAVLPSRGGGEVPHPV